MGYTHYFKTDLNDQQFAEVKADCGYILLMLDKLELKGSPSTQGYEDITLSVHNLEFEYDDQSFAVNGIDELSHETLLLQKNQRFGFNFCKTARKPYDWVVTLILMAVKYHAPESSISSDGNSDDWAESFKVWNQVFPDRKVEFRMANELMVLAI